ncbi:hypothetical protein DFP72DRAFT_881280 [Ephemerocybe angulata]|uniref:Uncharacterized protein n=1 Tax=Ephemerocybe angulata TaxID=980116 RepID=A0A8H6I846_9AGAR|nr:hypothetical protein DFP72DRAFT_881280 [Tulosesus angulatus]
MRGLIGPHRYLGMGDRARVAVPPHTSAVPISHHAAKGTLASHLLFYLCFRGFARGQTRFRKPKKTTHGPTKTTTIAPKTSKPSRKRPPRVLAQAASHSLPSLPHDHSLKPPGSPALAEALYEGITFERYVDVSLSAAPFLFGRLRLVDFSNGSFFQGW